MKQNQIETIQSKVKGSLIFAVIIASIISMGYFIWFYVKNDQPLSTDSAIWGTFGDFFGGVLNPIIAGLAFYWLTQSVLIQKHELSETQKVLAETQKAQKDQAITQEKQRFEDTFHSLLNQLNSVYHLLNDAEAKGASKIHRLHRSVFYTRERTMDEFITMMKSKDSSCSHYFRVLYQILNFILMKADFDKPAKSFEEAISQNVAESEKLYADIVRAFLDVNVTRLLAITTASNDSTDESYKFKKLIERYALLEYLEVGKYENLRDLPNYYNHSAFGSHPILGI